MDPGSGATPGGRPRHRSGPWALLTAPVSARTWRELAYLVAGIPLAVVSLVVLIAGLFTGALLAITLLGVPVVAGTVIAARHLGAVHRRLQRVLLHHEIAAPPPRRARPGLVGWVGGGLTDLAGWRAIAYIVVSFPFKVIGTYVMLMVWGLGLGLATHPLWWRIGDPRQVGADGIERRAAMRLGGVVIDTWPRAFAVAALGVVILLVAPWPARALVWLDRMLIGGLLGPGRLSQRVSDLEQTRAHAVDDSAATLRRIERDLHDGAQARLVALAMQLDMAREHLAGVGGGVVTGPGGGGVAGLGRPDAPRDDAVPADGDDLRRARELLDTAHRNATEAITELRDVTRRIHPPVLDQGLDAALATLAARSPVPVTLRAQLAGRPSPAVETIAYFCVAELLTNVAKHSGARRSGVDVVQLGAVLRLQVIDDGAGGAVAGPGGGLAGLHDRVRTIDGAMTITSPPGGPTLVTIDLPTGS